MSHETEEVRSGPPSVNGLAVASLVLGIAWLMWIGSILALVFGYVAKGQIDKDPQSQSGRGLALAGIVLGWVGVGTLVLMLALGNTGMFNMFDMPFMNRMGPRENYSSNGERIYMTGTSASGSEISYEGGPGGGMMSDALACADCHGRDGRGGQVQMMMETFSAPDIRGRAEDGLRQAITEGIRPGGSSLDPIMPRWQMSDQDLSDLIDYVATLGE